MTSGTPESIQNWVLPGFQNCLDFASISLLDAKAMRSVGSPATRYLRSAKRFLQAIEAGRSARRPREARTAWARQAAQPFGIEILIGPTEHVPFQTICRQEV